MKLQKKRIKQRIIKNPIIWFCIEFTLPKTSKRYRKCRKLYDWSETAHLARIEEKKKKQLQHEQLTVRINATFEDNIVRHGPLKGMKYPQKASAGSELYPKLLGSYEAELTNTINFILKQDYSTILDIGCAEGYYAVGIGMKMPHARIIAYDTDETALKLCQQMAQLNNVSIKIEGFCTEDTIISLQLKTKSLIISDCEGYESELFTSGLCSSLRSHDLLIECHDFIDINITPQLLRRLSQTHTVEIIESIDDISKAYEYDYPELQNFNLEERRAILAECRPQIMRWIFASANT
jgi:hypothetical protein